MKAFSIKLADSPARGFPIACENDAYSVTAELMGQYERCLLNQIYRM
jgi:hypothetical protein